MGDLLYSSTKTYTHNAGLSCCFRQWHARSHCNLLHGYALQVELTFVATQLDDRNWVVDFGGLDSVKEYLKNTFDHKCIVALDDPELGTFRDLKHRKLIELVIMDKVGCEAFAEKIFYDVSYLLETHYEGFKGRVKLNNVEVSEHEGNSASVTAI